MSLGMKPTKGDYYLYISAVLIIGGLFTAMWLSATNESAGDFLESFVAQFRSQILLLFNIPIFIVSILTLHKISKYTDLPSEKPLVIAATLSGFVILFSVFMIIKPGLITNKGFGSIVNFALTFISIWFYVKSRIQS